MESVYLLATWREDRRILDDAAASHLLHLQVQQIIVVRGQIVHFVVPNRDGVIGVHAAAVVDKTNHFSSAEFHELFARSTLYTTTNDFVPKPNENVLLSSRTRCECSKNNKNCVVMLTPVCVCVCMV